MEKQTQMVVAHQNILSKVMLKNVKLSYGSVRFQLARAEMYVVTYDVDFNFSV